jgi:hypothetical protein
MPPQPPQQQGPPVIPVQGYQPVRYQQPQNFYQRAFNAVPAQARQVNVPNGLPRILGNRSVIFNSWMIAMAIVSFDEWHNLKILPRPLRLWDTSLFFGMLAMFSVADVVVPVANAFAIGYTIMLLWQYYQGDITPQDQSTNPSGSKTASLSNPGNPQAGIVSPGQVNQPTSTPGTSS